MPAGTHADPVVPAGTAIDLRARRAAGLTVSLWLFVGVIYLPLLIERHGAGNPLSVALDFSTVFVSMLVAVPLYLVFRRTQGWPVAARLLGYGVAVAAAAAAQTLFDFQYSRLGASSFEPGWATLPRDLTRFWGALFNYCCAFGVNMALFNLSASRLTQLEDQRDLAAARQAAQAAQLAALRFQLNPHFLFNTLNAISAMIVTRRNDEAEQMTEKLCAFLRASIASEDGDLVPLEEELALVQDYLDIEAVRFGERLSVDIRCDARAEESEVPGFILQPLVENAVKYGVSRSRGPVQVRVRAEVEGGWLRLEVEDDATPDPHAPTQPGTGTGLANVRRRLEALYGAAARLTAGAHARGYRATIELPARPAG